MPKSSHLPAHMDSVRQKLRPKHQILILKCYPRLPKNSAADVKPNGSETSYLLYYASTRRSKLQKVGSFLEKKTARDVYNQQSARVLVTLQILTALLENKVVGEGSALALIAPYVMNIISGILLNTNDISLIEASQKTWDVFCRHQDQATLAADHEYRELYEKVVGQYAEYAHKAGAKKLGKSTTPVATHDAVRLRETGLHATKSVISSDALAYESGRHVLTITIPAILSNLRGNEATSIEQLIKLSKRNETEERDRAMFRRQSMATVRNIDSSVEVDPRAAEGTTQDADAIAEEGVAVLAFDCLKAVFTSENRAQTRSATLGLLNYLRDLQYYNRPQTSSTRSSDVENDTWAVKAYEQCVAWTPVQDRFILLVTAVDTMVHLPLKERDLRQHFLLTSLIGNTLRSDLNLIGLSVMDVLVSLIQQTLRLLQHTGPPGTATSQVASSSNELKPTTSAGSGTPGGISTDARLRLVDSLKACIADLSTHVYYTDQVSDMISAILMRLKPSPAPIGLQNPLTTALAIEEPKSAVAEVASNGSLPSPRGRSNTMSSFFSFDTARQVALEIVRDIIKVANSARAMNGSGVGDSRNPVHIAVWEGTQWLLRDPASDVRFTYTEALTAWLELETKKSDFRLEKPAPRKKTHESQPNGGALARRAVSNASATKDRVQNPANKKASSQQTFLQLLHLAVYENALQFATTSKKDITMLSTLLATLVKRLGANAVSSGLPMIFALQEEIARVESPVAKVRVGTLVHGYLWSLVEIFDCRQDIVGRDIVGEVARRKEHRIWVREVEYPPLPLETSKQRALNALHEDRLGEETVKHEELKAFDDRVALVDAVLEHYQANVISPTPSAPTSPGSSLTHPTSLERATSSYLSAKPAPDPQLMSKAREAMLSSWTKEGCLATIAAMSPRSISLSGSRTSPVQAAAYAQVAGGGNHRQLLSAVNTGPMRNGHGTPPKQRQQVLNDRLQSQSPDRRMSRSSAGKASSSAAHAPVRVEELKRILAGGDFTPVSTTGAARAHHHNNLDEKAGDDTASESMMTAEDDLGSDDGYVSSAAGFGQVGLATGKQGKAMDVDALLASIEIKETRRIGVGRPPY